VPAVGDGASLVAAIAAALVAGEAVVLPTDTVYGVAALPGDRSATARLFDLKGRGGHTPLAVLCADVEQALSLADATADARVGRVADRWWPGPLTLVLPRRPGVPLYLGEPATTVGLRVPAHPLVQALARAVGPLAVTSANRHGEPTPPTARAAAAALAGEVALVVDGGHLQGTASTVLDATTHPWRVIRQGALSATEILAFVDEAGSDE